MPIVPIEKLTDLSRQALEAAGAASEAARSTARFLVAAEAAGLSSHGVSRIPRYCAQLRNQRTVGDAQPRVIREKGGACLVDAGSGLAFPACELAVAEVLNRARKYGVAFAGVTNSNHFGVAAMHLHPIAEAGMVGLAFGNSPAAMPPWGGKTPIFGTNPIAAMFPCRNADPLAIDVSLSEVARGKIMIAAKEGKPIPLGWALDKEGNPTMDAAAALAGVLPVGSRARGSDGGSGGQRPRRAAPGGAPRGSREWSLDHVRPASDMLRPRDHTTLASAAPCSRVDIATLCSRA